MQARVANVMDRAGQFYQNRPLIAYGGTAATVAGLGALAYSGVTGGSSPLPTNANDIATVGQMAQMQQIRNEKLDAQLQQLDDITVAKERMRRAREVGKEPVQLQELQNEQQLNRYLGNALGSQFPIGMG
jgi:hypothetical protein